MLTTAALLTLAIAGGAHNEASGVCPIKDVEGVRGGKVTAGVTIDNGQSTAARKARCGVVADVVRTLVDEGAQMPMKVRGYRCTPTVSGPGGMKVAWRCVYQGGTPRTRVEAEFAYRLTA
jgi:hypothetical protein